MKTIKYSIYALLGLLVLAIVGVAVFAATFDPNRYKGEIERLVKERTGRTLNLKGDLAVAFWPSLGAKVGGVTLSERGSDTRFLALESAHALAQATKMAPSMPREAVLLVNLSGRGDKDMHTVAERMGMRF